MTSSPILSKATALRRKATTCSTLAACARSAIDRDQFMDMHDSYLSRARQEDWIEGLPPPPPANANALLAQRA